MRKFQVVSLLLLLAVAALTFSCGKKSSPTQPGPGGGGGGTLETFNSGSLPAGSQFQHTFTNTGSFDYRCTIHSGMNGTVVVVASGSVDAASVTTPGMTFSPSSVTINQGGTVTWDITGTNHTVTRP